MRCQVETGIPNLKLEEVPLRDDGRYEIVCNRGHRSLTLLQAEKFELLFDMGAEALIDGNPRDAVANFAAALERFHEFALQAMLIHNGVSNDDFRTIWKSVARSSERQLGAFYFVALMAFNRSFCIDENQFAFRNKVIHQGYICQTEEAFKYGQYVWEHISSILKLMRSEGYDSIFRDILFQRLAGLALEGGATTMAIPTILGLNRATEALEATFQQALDNFSRWRETDHLIEEIQENYEQCQKQLEKAILNFHRPNPV